MLCRCLGAVSATAAGGGHWAARPGVRSDWGSPPHPTPQICSSPPTGPARISQESHAFLGAVPSWDALWLQLGSGSHPSQGARVQRPLHHPQSTPRISPPHTAPSEHPSPGCKLTPGQCMAGEHALQLGLPCDLQQDFPVIKPFKPHCPPSRWSLRRRVRLSLP